MKSNISTGKVLVAGKPAPGIALHGYDPVAYFKGGQPVIGQAQFAVTQGDATYRFVSDANLDAFASDPQRYLPQFGGFCAFGVSVGLKLDGDPRVWRIVDDKLYVLLSEDIRQEWLKEIAGNNGKAETNWRTLADQAP